MADDEHRDASRGEEVLHLFKRGAEFTKELLEDNERLRRELVRFQEQQEYAARTPEDWDKLRRELSGRLKDLEAEYETVRQRLTTVESENRDFADRYLDIEEENNNLANLYVASYQLHSTLDLAEVVKIILEIVINLIGAEIFAVYMLDESSGRLEAVAAEGLDVSEFPGCRLGSGVLGEAVERGHTQCWDDVTPGNLDQPIVCIPLLIERRPIGALVIYELLQQKETFSALDHELFAMLGAHAATALFAARLHSQSERKLSTIQSFIDLLTK
jgi:nitrate/nitrite-specific signal transduction histidine kinase